MVGGKNPFYRGTGLYRGCIMAVQSKTKKKLIIASIVSAILILVIFLVAPFTVGAILYDGVFGERYETAEFVKLRLEDFDGLKADRHEFTSNGGNKLVGYRYYVDATEAKGVVVISHGLGGGGHNSYMDVAYYFAQRGYDVFAYDATGNDESEGKGVNGIPQGVADLSSAIDLLQEITELKDLPVMLWGHSWGGHCVSAVLNYHPEVKAVAAVAGFNRSGDLIKAQGRQMVGGFIGFMMPYVNSIERIKCGKYSSANALDGFSNSACGVLIAHSSDDTTVPIEYGYDKYYKKYADDKRFEFIRYENKGHNNIIYSDSYIAYLDVFNEQARAYFGGRAPSLEERIDYVNKYLDREIYCNGLDAGLFDKILNFYDANL